MIDFDKITNNWNADPNDPQVNIKLEKDSLLLTFGLNYFQYNNFKAENKLQITFKNCSKYSLNNCNDECYYNLQYRISPYDLPWGEFYEIISGISRDFPEAINIYKNNNLNLRHFIFFFKDNTFECLAEEYHLKVFKQ